MKFRGAVDSSSAFLFAIRFFNSLKSNRRQVAIVKILYCFVREIAAFHSSVGIGLQRCFFFLRHALKSPSTSSSSQSFVPSSIGVASFTHVLSRWYTISTHLFTQACRKHTEKQLLLAGLTAHRTQQVQIIATMCIIQLEI